MSQSGATYLSQGSKLEYLASSIQYSVSSSPLEYTTQQFFHPSYQSTIRTASPALYNSSQSYPVSSRFSLQGYDSAKEYTYFQTIQSEYHFVPDQFIRAGKEGAFIGTAEEIRPFVEEAFQKIFNCLFPNHININILHEKEFRKIAPHPGIIGLSLNRTKYGGVSDIFVLNDSLARVMLTLGHELGHVLTETLSDSHDEEAKAYAFSLAWMKVIKEHNIADLAEALVLENPAHNGLHNVAFAFVQELLKSGKSAWRIYLDIIRCAVSISRDSIFPHT